MPKVPFAIALLAAAVLGWAVGLYATQPELYTHQGVILHMPVSGDGIVTGAVKRFYSKEECEMWLKPEMKKLYAMHTRWSQVESIGRCHGR